MKVFFVPSNYYSLEHCAEMSENLKDKFDKFEIIDLSNDDRIRVRVNDLSQFNKYTDLRYKKSRILVTLRILIFVFLSIKKGDTIIFLQANSKWQLRLIHKLAVYKCRFIYWQWARVSVGDRISRGKVNILSPMNLYKEIWVKSKEEKDEILKGSIYSEKHDCYVIGYLWKSKVKRIALDKKSECVVILFNDLTAVVPQEFFDRLDELVASLVCRGERVILKLHPNCEEAQYNFLIEHGNVEIIHGSSYQAWLDIIQRAKYVIANYTSLIYDCLLAEIPVYGLLDYKEKYLDLMSVLLEGCYFNSREMLLEELDEKRTYDKQKFRNVESLLPCLKLPGFPN